MKIFHSSVCQSKPQEPITYIVDGLIPRGVIADISGPPGGGKSTILLSLAAAISSGTLWFGLATEKTKTAFISGEASGNDAIGRDLQRLSVSEKTDILFFLPEFEMFRFDSRSQQWITSTEGRAVLDEIRKQGIELLVIDTIGSVVSGSKEIDNDQQRQLARHIRKELKGLTCISISHTNQASAKDDLDWRLHYLSRAGGNGFPGAVRFSGGVSQLQPRDAKTVGIAVDAIVERKLVGFGVSKYNEMPTPVWTNRAPAIFEIKQDGGLVLVKDGREINQTEKIKGNIRRVPEKGKRIAIIARDSKSEDEYGKNW